MPIFSIEGTFPNNISVYNSQRSTKRKDSETTEDQSRTRSKQSDNTDNEPDKTNELTASEQQQTVKLAARDREVRAHEAAHTAAGGGLIKGAASFSYEKGPDGKQYATGGDVSIDISKVPDNPQATLTKANQIRAAALAPATPSGKDRSVAAGASAMANEARVEIREQSSETTDSKQTDKEPTTHPDAPDRIATENKSTVNNFTKPSAAVRQMSPRQSDTYITTAQPHNVSGNNVDLFA